MGGLGGDNMTIIIICFLHGKPWQHLVDKCKKIHSEKKALSKLMEPAFSTFDRFAADGPFSEVSVLKTSDSAQNSNDSSSHTSSPSSSPISTEEKFDSILADSIESTGIINEDEKKQSEDANLAAEMNTKKTTSIAAQKDECVDENTTKKLNDVISENVTESSSATETSSSVADNIVSNGESN